MSEYTRAVFGSLQTGEADFAGTYAQLQSTISTLDGQLKSSLSQWDGEAQAAYYAAKAKWDAAMANMAAVLNNLRGVIGEAHVNYSSTEASNAALWGG
jgi:early secretory antigenic target protein ESAT-6